MHSLDSHPTLSRYRAAIQIATGERPPVPIIPPVAKPVVVVAKEKPAPKPKVVKKPAWASCPVKAKARLGLAAARLRKLYSIQSRTIDEILVALRGTSQRQLAKERLARCEKEIEQQQGVIKACGVVLAEGRESA